jgi:hypothetical protein
MCLPPAWPRPGPAPRLAPARPRAAPQVLSGQLVAPGVPLAAANVDAEKLLDTWGGGGGGCRAPSARN